MYLIRSLKIVAALLRVPQLFVMLILFPLLLSIILIFVQFAVSQLLVSSTKVDSKSVAEATAYFNKKSFTRFIVYGSYESLQSIEICRWTMKNGVEVPPGRRCVPDRLDLAIRTDSPATFNVEPYLELVEGNFERVHICSSCEPDIIIFPNTEGRITTETRSVFGLALLKMARYNETVVEGYVSAAKNIGNVHAMLGDIQLSFPGFRSPIPVTHAPQFVGIILNIAGMIIISLWLALKAHRRVLDYFSKSGALMPLVVATGGGAFYTALWILTFVRVAAFLLAVLPWTLLSITVISRELPPETLFTNDIMEFSLWVVTLAASFGLATLLASVADLKSRHTFVGWVYRYFPMFLCALGALLWVLLFLFEGAYFIRDIISSMPVVGSLPILLAPLFKPRMDVLCLHLLLSTLLVIVIMRYNTKWFAAHLEDL